MVYTLNTLYLIKLFFKIPERDLRVRVMVFNCTFNNISAILWQSVLLVEETEENLITQCCIECTSPWAGFELTILVVIGTDCTGSCKSNYHTIMTMTAPSKRFTSSICFEHIFQKVHISNLCSITRQNLITKYYCSYRLIHKHAKFHTIELVQSVQNSAYFQCVFRVWIMLNENGYSYRIHNL
jgi:hypothetical protein